ncbi:MAG: response regulator transcription factor [Chitinophagaceae bacterium]|nr:response regulator transcription factor [Chitinophagaceae bacterium]
MMKRIIIFDDNDIRREGLELLLSLSEGFECVGTFRDGSQVMENIINTNPDVVLMDIEMPNVNGIEAVTKIRAKYPDLKILMQTAFEDDEKIFNSIRAGADGYILKKAKPNDLLKAIEEVLEGGAPMTPSIARQVLRMVNSPHEKKEIPDFNLTSRQHEILSLLVEGYSYKMIAAKCNISFPTVSSHIQAIFEKLQVNSSTEAAVKALQHNIVQEKKTK